MRMERLPSLSVVIPAYDEERRLPGTLARVLQHLRAAGRRFEVVVVDDGSEDATAEVAAAAGSEVRVVRIPHAGKGAAVRTGVMAAQGERVLVTDADLSAPIGELGPLDAALDLGAGLAIGSRRIRTSRLARPQPLVRRAMGRLFSVIARTLVLPGIADSQCGFKLFRRDVARRVFSVARVDGFAFDVEAILLVRQLGERVVEVPVEWRDSPGSRIRPVRDSAAMAADLLRIRLRSRADRWMPWGLTGSAAPIAPGRRGPGEAAVVLCLALAVYLAAAVVWAQSAHLVAGDALSRVAIAHRVLFSRDPHLAAVGFVWCPLPVLALLPLVPLKWAVPAMTDYGFIADGVSAVCMAMAAREVCAFLGDLEVRRPSRWALTAAFALHPLIVLYAANGMSEAMFLLFLLAAARRFAIWAGTGDAAAGVGCAVALAMAYVTRYEAFVAGAAAIGLAAAIGYRRQRGTARQRRDRAFADAALVGMPVVTAFAVWAAISWAIVGSPMDQFTSVYGNTAQRGVYGALYGAVQSILVMRQLLHVEPFVAALVVAGVIRSVVQRRAGPAIAIAGVLGSVLAFMTLSTAKGVIADELRYLIVSVPLSVLAVGMLLARPAGVPARPAAGREASGPARRPRLRLAAGAAALAATLVALPVQAAALPDAKLDPGDYGQVQALVEHHAGTRFDTERSIALDLDAMDLPPSSVLLDDFLGFPIPLISRHPTQFVITSDRDFQSTIADPAGSGIRYLLVPQPVDLGRLDALNRDYPSLYANGGGMATLVRTYQPHGEGVAWRLYRLKSEASAR